MNSVLTFVDVETSGMSPHNDRIIEIGIIRVEKNKVIDEYSKLINPKIAIPWYITNVTGLKGEDLLKAPSFEDIIDEISALLEGGIFIAHNVEFDYQFIKNEYKRVQQDFGMDRMCTVNLSRALYPMHKRHNLDSVTDRHKITISNRHRALDDAYALWEFYQIVNKEFSEFQIQKVLSQLIKKTSIKKDKIPTSQFSMFN